MNSTLPSADKLKENLVDSGRKTADINAEITLRNPLLIKPLLELSYRCESPWCQRASRIISLSAAEKPDIIQPYSSEMIRRLSSFTSESVIRNFLKIYMEVPVKLTKRDKEHLLNACFDFLAGDFSVGVKVYSMDILYALSDDFPEIRKELYFLVESQIEDASAGFKSRGSKILKKLSI
jgi:hypothetical protein